MNTKAPKVSAQEERVQYPRVQSGNAADCGSVRFSKICTGGQNWVYARANKVIKADIKTLPPAYQHLNLHNRFSSSRADYLVAYVANSCKNLT